MPIYVTYKNNAEEIITYSDTIDDLTPKELQEIAKDLDEFFYDGYNNFYDGICFTLSDSTGKSQDFEFSREYRVIYKNKNEKTSLTVNKGEGKV